MQYRFDFIFPYPAGCLHVSEHGTDGYAIDDCSRVCSQECAEAWARVRGKVLTGVHRVNPGDGTMSFQSFSTKYPEEIVRPSFAHLASIMRGS